MLGDVSVSQLILTDDVHLAVNPSGYNADRLDVPLSRCQCSLVSACCRSGGILERDIITSEKSARGIIGSPNAIKRTSLRISPFSYLRLV